MVTEEAMNTIARCVEEEEKYAAEYDKQCDSWWKSLSYEDQLKAFHSVVKRIYEGDVKQQGSYRYVLNDVFGFAGDAYLIGMNCGYMSLHNAIKTTEEERILRNHRANKGQNVDV